MVISATDWLDHAAERRHPHIDYRPMATMFTPIVPWFVCRDEEGCWCVQRHGAWSCVIKLTGATSLPNDRMEQHARDVADVLNRVYARTARAW